MHPLACPIQRLVMAFPSMALPLSEAAQRQLLVTEVLPLVPDWSNAAAAPLAEVELLLQNFVLHSISDVPTSVLQVSQLQSVPVSPTFRPKLPHGRVRSQLTVQAMPWLSLELDVLGDEVFTSSGATTGNSQVLGPTTSSGCSQGSLAAQE